MAKIILVSKHVNATSWQLAQALRAQQHEVVLLTSYGETPRDTSGIEFMGYFKRWSALEGLRIIPGLFGLQPQILHILLDDDRMNPAQIILSMFAKSHPSCVLTTSLLNIRYGLTRRNPVRYLIEESDIVTCPTVEALGQLRGLDVRSNRQGRGILPPVLDLKSAQEQNLFDAEEEALFIESLEKTPYVVVPFRETDFNSESDSFIRIRTLAQKYKVVLWGSYAHWTLRDRKKFAAWMEEFQCGGRWTVTGTLTENLGHLLLEKSTAFVLAGQTLTPVEMTEYYMRAIHSHAVLILDSKQTSVHSDLWKNAVNCWVLNHHHLQKDLVKLLAKPHLKLPENLSEQLAEDRHLIDSSLNELNRLYNKALNHLR
ncbi:hypothetical protein QJS83_06625 [Bdellovibrio sp. 22V]|uniref:hypothetical protein n=1 Tax=Bdellovibrio sp. 22V TaxID=3044166 RepID=UPI002542D819|nr:hypothetical protein [Bdellovibrio sp. 22V]WII73545.1 hypothetical protein QJS83_06625 [Bdellovibrio sp. 22V]